MLTNTINVLLVEDSAAQQELLIHILDSDPAIRVIGIAGNGLEAIEALKTLSPTLVVMDLHMPKMNGVDAIRHIMATTPLPIVAISASDTLDDIVNGFHALEAGAVAFAEKPRGLNNLHFETQRDYFLQTVKLMSEIKVIRRNNLRATQLITKINLLPKINNINIIAIGVSTGGPLVLKSILSALPKDFPPILIVQHISSGFITGLAEWLTDTTNHVVELATHNLLPERGHIYLAVDDSHMGVAANGRIFLKPASDEKICPSVGFLFNTIATVFKDKAMGILLTGMGSDGALELKQMKDNGAITIAQSKETCLIYGMPGQAVALKAATYTLSPEEIAQTISHLTL